jgi:hypothetical protein
MSEIVKTTTQTVETSKEQTDQAQPKTPTKDEHGHPHHHHRHQHAYISPASTGTPHLNPGSISIGGR